MTAISCGSSTRPGSAATRASFPPTTTRWPPAPCWPSASVAPPSTTWRTATGAPAIRDEAGSGAPPGGSGCASRGPQPSAKATSYRRLAERVRASGVRSVYLNSFVAANLGSMLRDLDAVLDSRVAIIGNQGFLPISLLLANAGSAARGVHITSPGLPIDRLGATGRRFVRAFGATQPRRRVTNVDAYAATATEVLLDAIARSNGTRSSVARALATTRLADSPLGPLTLDRRGELVSNPVSVVRAERSGGEPVDLSLDGSVTEDVITPPARLVQPNTARTHEAGPRR